MKKFFVLICASATLFVGCEAVEDLFDDLFGDDAQEEQPVEEAVFLNVSGDGEIFRFPPEGGTFSVGVESSHYWIIEMNYNPTDQQNWISVSKYGGKGSNHVDITVAPNTDYTSHRRCELVFMMEEQGVGRCVVIEQEPALL